MRRTFLAALLLAASAGAAVPAAAQSQQNLVIQAGAIGQNPVAAAGVRWTLTPAPGEPRRDPETGMPLPVPANWSFQLMVTAGAHFGDETDWTVLGTAGLRAPRGSTMIAGIGPVVMVSYRPHAVGPGLRIETLLNAIGVQGGALWRLEGPDDPLFTIQVDITDAFLRDVFMR
ncbi:MAG TPA: hypothetical protein VFQ45_12350 [Longimicrobium sp.]|nr:hypothetical protein [Longimicrobium sp.]